MTPQNLQDEIKEMLEEVSSEIDWKDIDGERTKLSVFKQNLPKRDTDEDDPFPYCIIRLVSGNHNAIQDEENSIRVLLIFGLCDNGLENQGETMLNLINRIVLRLSENNVLKTFYQKGKIEWAIDDEDTYPYFFGGMDLSFVPAFIPRREEMFL